MLSVKQVLRKAADWIRGEIVFSVIFCLTVVSMFFVPPSPRYADYIDWNTILILFSLMAVVAGLNDCGLFQLLGTKLCRSVRGERQLCAVLVFLCFFTSMLITNDVALLTFVPFAVALLGTQNQRRLIAVVVLQTIAANTGSMLTPIGNPQNLFLFAQMSVPLDGFLLIMLPLTLASAVLLLAATLLLPALKARPPEKTVDNSAELESSSPKAFPDSGTTILPAGRTLAFGLMFTVCIGAVLHALPYWVAAVITLVGTLLFSRGTLLKVDYMLLVTFICFFVFTGNIAAMDGIRHLLQQAVTGADFACGVIASQVISNVPAALMLFPFSGNLQELLLGVNLGGLGTLVGSLASLISFKLYVKTPDAKTGGYMATFTVLNIVFLALLIGVKVVIG